MTDAEREELIQKMAKAVVLAENASALRVALAVAEPVIREWCAKEIDDYRLSYGGSWPALEILAAAIREGGKDE